jgi:DNA-binding response OmpR family regulator
MPGDVRFKKILVIDDEPCIADTLAIILSTQSYDVQVAYGRPTWQLWTLCCRK